MDDEAQLVQRVIARHPEAEDEFVRRYSGLVLGLARGRFNLVGSAADDALQTVIEKLWSDDFKALRAWRGNGKLTTYLTVIVTRQLLRQRQNQARRPEDALDPADLQAASDRVGDRINRGHADAALPDEALLAREREDLVSQEWRLLPPRDRLLLAARFTDGRTPREIATVTGQSSGTIRKAIHDAVARLRRRLASRRPELFETKTKVASTPMASEGEG